MMSAFDDVSKALNLVRVKAGAEFVQKKTIAGQKKQTTLPRHGEPGYSRRTGDDRGKETPKKGLTAELHDKAWEAFQSRVTSNE
jgi:hypothetical protein